MLRLSEFDLIFLLVNIFLIFLLPNRWAPLSLLIGACYMTRSHGVEVGPLSFPVIRILIAAGYFRVIIRRQSLKGKTNSLDWLVALWAACAIFSSVFHANFTAALIYRLGLVYDAAGFYFLFRVFFKTMDDIEGLCVAIAVLLMPVAIEMVFEKVTSYNFFFSDWAEVRDGKIRSRGPFSHSILAGTVGAVCLPLIISLWNQHRKATLVGLLSCLTMIITSTSSGPIIAGFAAIAALFSWRYRNFMRPLRYMGAFLYVLLDLYMKDPAYYIIARIDLTGSSTGWHRAKLIQSAFEHFSEWWIGGTDYTRHWMPTGVPWSEDHTDITNQYLAYGVIGGLPLMLIFIIILIRAFSFVGQMISEKNDILPHHKFMMWAFGSSLFAQAMTGLSISYFDQSIIFLLLTLGGIATAKSTCIQS